MQVSVVVSVFSQPLEVLRTSLVLEKQTQMHSHGLTDLCRQTLRKKGYKEFFKGTTIAIAKNSLSAIVYFSGIENISKLTNAHMQEYHMSHVTSSIINFVTALFSKFCSILVVNPLIVIKTKVEMIGDPYSGTYDCIKKTYNKGGIKGFYKGIIPTLIRDGPYSGLQYGTYMNLLKVAEMFVENPKDHASVISLCAGTSSAMIIMLTYPFDNIRVRWQAGETKGYPLKEIIPYVYKKEGFLGFYRGLLPRVLKKTTSASIFWTFYEQINRSLDKTE